MRFGLCTDVRNIGEVAALGFDYLEAKLNQVALLEEAEFEAICREVEKAPIRVERCCLLLPKSMSVIGASYDEEALTAYLETAFSRMKRLGADLVVFGSGKSRAFGPELSYQEAFTQLVGVTRLIGEVAARHGVTIAIEPLNRKETNLINTLGEGAALQAAVNLPNVGLLADAYHLRSECEPLSRIGETAPLMHTHIALLEGRRYPTEASDEVAEFFASLKAASYDGTMSIEGSSDDYQGDGKKALAVLRSM
ncbi:MAG TPA: sugar phosphate isomerase/epimerase family protein [Sphaerochaeta sp.]|jgi:D-psicose/D-tagatose/L-ribulose 3-epimerase|nr:sugar phosphate isomerase/epimerase family protein [Sphaerochaeta sp.]HPZ16493.1 sugar phosphate isomerase/epimerase family protein [Sphaerochaeta sp.]